MAPPRPGSGFQSLVRPSVMWRRLGLGLGLGLGRGLGLGLGLGLRLTALGRRRSACVGRVPAGAAPPPPRRGTSASANRNRRSAGQRQRRSVASQHMASRAAGASRQSTLLTRSAAMLRAAAASATAAAASAGARRGSCGGRLLASAGSASRSKRRGEAPWWVGGAERPRQSLHGPPERYLILSGPTRSVSSAPSTPSQPELGWTRTLRTCAAPSKRAAEASTPSIARPLGSGAPASAAKVGSTSR
eukprot:scaffold53013_cov47-Phaeocystis_antarctica.AAC.5